MLLSVFAVLFTLHEGSWQVVFFATLISSILSQFSQPSGLKLFKMHLSPDLIQSAMSIYQTIFAIFMVLGPVIGTIVFQQFGIEISIAITGVAFLFSAAILFLLPKDVVDHAAEQKASTILQDMKSGLVYVASKKELKLLGICFLVSGLAIGLIHPLAIFIVTEQLGLAKENLQWLLMVNGIGMVLGGMVAAIFSSSTAPQKLLVAGMCANAIGMSIIGFSTNLPLTLAAEFVNGFFLPYIQIGINTLILQGTKSEFIGRVNGILMPLFTGAMVVTMSLAGVLKANFSLMLIFEFAALLFIIGLVAILPIYNMKTLNSTEEEMVSQDC